MYDSDYTSPFDTVLEKAAARGFSDRDVATMRKNIGCRVNIVELIRTIRAKRQDLPTMRETLRDEYKQFGSESLDRMKADAKAMGLVGEHDQDVLIDQVVEKNDSMTLLLLAMGAPSRRTSPEDTRRFLRAADAASLIANEGYILAEAAQGFGEQFVVNELHPSAVRTVKETDLAFWPSSAPKPLTRPMLVKADRTKGTGYLFHNIHTVLWVPYKDGTQNILIQGDAGFGKAVTNITWNTDRTEATNRVLRADIDQCFLGKVEDDKKVAMEASSEKIAMEAVIQWLVKLALFFEAESTSGKRMTTCDPRIATLPNGRPAPKGQSFTVRYLRISDEALTKPQREASADHPPPPHPDNLASKEVMVRGFLRRQVCGKGGKDRKVIYVAPHVSHRYVSPEKEVRVL